MYQKYIYIDYKKSLELCVYNTNFPIPVIGDVCDWGYNILTEYKNGLLRMIDPNIGADQYDEASTRDVDIIVELQMTRFEVDDWLGQKQENYPSVPTATYLNLVIAAQLFYEQCFNNRTYVEGLVTFAFNSIKSNPETYRVYPNSERFKILVNDVELFIQLSVEDRQLTAASYVAQVGGVKP